MRSVSEGREWDSPSVDLKPCPSVTSTLTGQRTVATTQMRSLEPSFLAPSFCRSFNVASTYPVGLSAVKDEQHGLVTGWNSISSIRVPSGS